MRLSGYSRFAGLYEGQFAGASVGGELQWRKVAAILRLEAVAQARVAVVSVTGHIPSKRPRRQYMQRYALVYGSLSTAETGITLFGCLRCDIAFAACWSTMHQMNAEGRACR